MIHKPLTYSKQWIDKDDIAEVITALKSGIITQGEYISKFEKKLADKVSAKYAVAVTSGTAALHIAYLALGLKSKDTIITTPITFAATANAALYTGAKPIFADILPFIPLIDPDKIEKSIKPSTKIIAPVHYGGLVCDMKAIHRIAKKYKLYVVEDACHALGSIGDGFTVGSCKYSDMTVFSFHPVKHITTGEGGAITTNNADLYKILLLLRNHGIERTDFINTPDNPRYYEMQLLGMNYRITDIQCALGLSQMRKLDFFVQRRRKIAEIYDNEFKNIKDIRIIQEPQKTFNSYHLYPILFQSQAIRDKIFYALEKEGIQTQIHYIPVYKHPYYQATGYKNTTCPNGEKFYSQVLSIPMYPKMSNEEVEYTVKVIKKVIGELK